jgi:hypothetical protein
MNLIAILSPLHPSRGFDPIFATVATAMGLAGIGYALRMILRPKMYFEILERRLQNYEYQIFSAQSARATRKANAIKRLIYSKAPLRNIRIQGFIILLLVILFEIGSWSELLPGLFAR